jgi:hypothetical protein
MTLGKAGEVYKVGKSGKGYEDTIMPEPSNYKNQED